jgi:large subunit ribosomal protein L10
MRTREQKEAEVVRLREKVSRANAIVLADYRGLTVPESNDLRTRLRATGEGEIEYRVAQNTLLRLAVRGTDVEPLEGHFQGPTALAIAYEEPLALTKTLVEYAKQNERFEIKGGFVDGELVDLDAIRRMAALPSKDELRSKLMATMLAPMQNLTSGLYALLGNVRNALEQRQKQLEG